MMALLLAVLRASILLSHPPVFRLSSLSNVAMERKHLVILCNLSFGDKTIASHALIDCGATGVAFVDEDFARHHQLPLTPLKYPRALEVIDGRPISSGDITHTTNATLSIHEHREKIPMFVTKLGHYPIVLGIPWMELHDVAIRFSSRTLTFGSQYCITNCNPGPTVAHAISSEPPEPALCSLVSKVAPGEPVVSAGAGDIGAQLFMSPQVNNTAQADRTKPRLDARNRLALEAVGPGLNACNGLGLDAHNGLGLNARNGLGLEAVGLGLDVRNGLGLDARNGLGLDAHNGLGLEAVGLGLDARNGLGLDAGNGLGLDARNGLRLEAPGPGPSTKPIQIAALGGHSFRRIAHKEQLTVFSLSLYKIN